MAIGSGTLSAISRKRASLSRRDCSASLRSVTSRPIAWISTMRPSGANTAVSVHSSQELPPPTQGLTSS